MPRSQRDTAIADTFNRRAKSVWLSPIRFRNFSILAAHDGLATLAPDRTVFLASPTGHIRRLLPGKELLAPAECHRW